MAKWFLQLLVLIGLLLIGLGLFVEYKASGPKATIVEDEVTVSPPQGPWNTCSVEVPPGGADLRDLIEEIKEEAVVVGGGEIPMDWGYDLEAWKKANPGLREGELQPGEQLVVPGCVTLFPDKEVGVAWTLTYYEPPPWWTPLTLSFGGLALGFAIGFSIREASL